MDHGQESRPGQLVSIYATDAMQASSTCRSTTSTTTQREQLMHSQLVVDNSKERLGPTGCEIHTSMTHRATGSLTKLLYQFHCSKFDVLTRHQMYHHRLISKGNRDRSDLKDIFPVGISEVVKDRLKYRKVAQTIGSFQNE